MPLRSMETGLRPDLVNQHIPSMLESPKDPGKRAVSSNLRGFSQFLRPILTALLVTGNP